MFTSFFLGLFFLILLVGSLKEGYEHFWAKRWMGVTVCMVFAVGAALGLLWRIGII
jgi:hypothetical protein